MGLIMPGKPYTHCHSRKVALFPDVSSGWEWGLQEEAEKKAVVTQRKPRLGKTKPTSGPQVGPIPPPAPGA